MWRGDFRVMGSGEYNVTGKKTIERSMYLFQRFNKENVGLIELEITWLENNLTRKRASYSSAKKGAKISNCFSLKMATAKTARIFLWPNYFKRRSFFPKILQPHQSLEFYLASWSQCIYLENVLRFVDKKTWPLQSQKVVTMRSTLEVYSHSRRNHQWRKDFSWRRKIASSSFCV